jgi:hypothetical protein
MWQARDLTIFVTLILFRGASSLGKGQGRGDGEVYNSSMGGVSFPCLIHVLLLGLLFIYCVGHYYSGTTLRGFAPGTTHANPLTFP